jgi:hypothetical protein
MPPDLAGAVALPHPAPWAICPRAAVGADLAIGLETRGLAGSAFFLGLWRAAVATPLGAVTILVEQRRAGDAQEQARRDASQTIALMLVTHILRRGHGVWLAIGRRVTAIRQASRDTK